MKKVILFLIAFISTFTINAQNSNNDYYYYNGTVVNLSKNTQYLTLITTESFQKSSIAHLGFKDFRLKDIQGSTPKRKIAKLEFTTLPSLSHYNNILLQLRSISGVVHVGTYYNRGANVEPIGTSNTFYVKLKNPADYPILQNYAISTNTKILKQVPYMPYWYIMELNNTIHNAVSMANQFYESNLFADVDPAFMFNFRENCSNDPNFNAL